MCSIFFKVDAQKKILCMPGYELWTPSRQSVSHSVTSVTNPLLSSLRQLRQLYWRILSLDLSVRGSAAWWPVKRQIYVHFEWIFPVNESRCVNTLIGNRMQPTRRVHAQQPVLFSEHLILTAPVTGTRTCIVFYTLKRSLPVATVPIKFFF
jgi:hypothetical protein